MQRYIPHILIALSGFLVAINLFRFPYYENDEGTYMSQAWALVSQGRLSPYTYNYDHAPGGWLLISLWASITGGFNTFGFSINTGRVLMLLLHIFSSILLYLIARRLTSSINSAIVALVIFSFSPLAVYYHRRVLLDNIMVFWVMFSMFMLLYHRSLRSITASAFTFAIGTLTKETAILLLPGFVYLLWLFQPNLAIKKIGS